MPSYSAAENPFRVERMHGIAYWEAGFDWDAFLTACAAADWRGAIVGPHGQGKTTLLLELRAHVAALGRETVYVVVGDEKREEAHVVPCADTIYFVDGAERLDGMAWFAFRRRMRDARGMIITAHIEGRLPTIHACHATVETVRYLLWSLVPGDDALAARAEELLTRYHGDCRQILMALYDEYAGRGRA